MKEEYSLERVDGNAFAILGYVINCMKKENRPQIEIDEFLKEAKSQDYDHLLAVATAVIDQLNDQ